jgi:hypothetical protein
MEILDTNEVKVTRRSPLRETNSQLSAALQFHVLPIIGCTDNISMRLKFCECACGCVCVCVCVLAAVFIRHHH